MKKRVTSMTAWLAIGITAVVALAFGIGAWFYSRHHFHTLLESARATALAQSEMIRAALEHQMMENDRSLIAELIASYGKEPGVSAVVLLDREGNPRYSSVPLAGRTDLRSGSPTCQACHRYPAAQRAGSRVIETPGGELLRSMVPFRNREACHRCHDPAHRINGVLLVDLDAGAIRAEVNRDLRGLILGSGALMLILITAIGVVFRLVVVRRLRRFETTARLIAAGDLERRVLVGGNDIVSWLAREFNAMADSMSGLVHEVREQRERLERVINSMDDGIVVLDAERRAIAANDAFLRRARGCREEVLGSICQQFSSGMCGPSDCPTLACLASGDPQVRIREGRTAAGELRWDEVHASPIRDSSGRIRQVVEVWRDISKRREAEAQLAESHRLASLGLLASGFSHELNTPLATTLACVEGILGSAQDDIAAGRDGGNDGGEPSSAPEMESAALAGWRGLRERICENARIAREQLLRCRGITQHFLRLFGGKPAPMEIVELGPTLDSVARLIAPTAAGHSVRIEVETVAEGAQVLASEAELQQVLLNLLLNAVQACGSRGRVRLSAECDHSVRIRVTDDGRGIAPEDQKRIFEPFLSLRKGGTGLGLYLSRNFVRRWGGDIRVRSTVGAGSTFEVILPVPAAGMAGVERGP